MVVNTYLIMLIHYCHISTRVTFACRHVAFSDRLVVYHCHLMYLGNIFHRWKCLAYSSTISNRPLLSFDSTSRLYLSSRRIRIDSSITNATWCTWWWRPCDTSSVVQYQVARHCHADRRFHFICRQGTRLSTLCRFQCHLMYHDNGSHKVN